jgi:hypothetical protein
LPPLFAKKIAGQLYRVPSLHRSMPISVLQIDASRSSHFAEARRFTA